MCGYFGMVISPIFGDDKIANIVTYLLTLLSLDLVIKVFRWTKLYFSANGMVTEIPHKI